MEEVYRRQATGSGKEKRSRRNGRRCLVAVMEKVDTDGNVLGFSIMKVSSLKGGPFEVALA